MCVLRQSELGLEKNFQTQSIAERSEFINRTEMMRALQAQ